MTIDDVMLNGETRIFPRSEHAIQSLHIQIERLKDVYFYLFFCSLSLEETKGAEVTQLDYQH